MLQGLPLVAVDTPRAVPLPGPALSAACAARTPRQAHHFPFPFSLCLYQGYFYALFSQLSDHLPYYRTGTVSLLNSNPSTRWIVKSLESMIDVQKPMLLIVEAIGLLWGNNGKDDSCLLGSMETCLETKSRCQMGPGN